MYHLPFPRPSPNTPSGRGVMSIAGLSYGVVRVEEAGSITSLTLQDVGLVMPGGKERNNNAILYLVLFIIVIIARVAIVKATGIPLLCKTDEVGEIVLESASCGSGYWGLQGKTNQTFKVLPSLYNLYDDSSWSQGISVPLPPSLSLYTALLYLFHHVLFVYVLTGSVD